MDVSAPHRALAGGIAADILVVLAQSHARQALSGRELAKRVGRSHNAVQRVLANLVNEGIVERRDVPPAALFSLNADHLAAPIAFSLAELTASFVARLRDRIASWVITSPQATLFGSAARRDGDASSDIDLLIVRQATVDPVDERWRTQLDDLSDAVERWTGNHAQILELGEDELLGDTEGPSALDGALVHGVTLTDQTLPSYLRAARRRTS